MNTDDRQGNREDPKSPVVPDEAATLAAPVSYFAASFNRSRRPVLSLLVDRIGAEKLKKHKNIRPAM